MNILKFYKDSKRFFRHYYSQDEQFLICRDEFDKKHEWCINRLTYKSDSMREYTPIQGSRFAHYIDAMKAIQEVYYPDWKLQKKLIKKED